MDAITPEEEQEMKNLLVQFYGPAANNWRITPEMYEVLGRLVLESKVCTQAMHLVPRPWNFRNPLRWAQREVRQALVRYLFTAEGKHYVSCMKVSANNFRREFDMASMGI